MKITRWLGLFLLCAGITMADSVPLADESLRLAALHAIFPGMRISLVPGMRIDDSWPGKTDQLNAPDALAKESVYRVIGDATNEAEKQASESVITHKISNTRLVRFQLFPWPSDTGLAAVLQYKFEDATPSMACPSIGLLVHLASQAGAWQVRDRHLLETTHHFSLKTVRMLNLGGNGDELVVESDFGGADTWGTNFMVFHLGEKFEPVFETTSQVSAGTDAMFTQAFDVPQTVELHGMQFCFTKTTMVENGIAFGPARVSKLCYKPNEDADLKESDERSKLLTPLSKP